jgi:transcriptional regulator with XRE-family HTH domain
VFAENLKRIRKGTGFTQAQLAEKAGVPLRTLQKREQGDREPRLVMLSRFARILGSSVDNLLVDGAGEGLAVLQAGQGHEN